MHRMLKYATYRVKQPFKIGGFVWLGWLPLILGAIVVAQKLSSMSRTFARRDLEETSFLSISLIFFCMRMLFLVIFSPGRDILSIQGIHCRKIFWTWTQGGSEQCSCKKSEIPILASHECPPGGGDSWAQGWWSLRWQPPWTLWRWNRWLKSRFSYLEYLITAT